MKCNCPNMHLLDVGEVCELCMGIVPPGPLDWEGWPEVMAYLNQGEEPDPFDELYFEELESYFSDIDYAA